MKKYIVIILMLFTTFCQAECLSDDELLNIINDKYYIESCNHEDFNDVLGNILYQSAIQKKMPGIKIIVDRDVDIEYIKALNQMSRFLLIEVFVENK